MKYLILILLMLLVLGLDYSDAQGNPNPVIPRPGRGKTLPSVEPSNSTVSVNGTSIRYNGNNTIGSIISDEPTSASSVKTKPRKGRDKALVLRRRARNKLLLRKLQANGTVSGCNEANSTDAKSPSANTAENDVQKKRDEALIDRLRRKNMLLLKKLKVYQDQESGQKSCRSTLADTIEKYNKNKQSATALLAKVADLQKKLKEETMFMDSTIAAKEKAIHAQFVEKETEMETIITALNYTILHHQEEVKLCKRNGKRLMLKRIRNQKLLCSSQIRELEKAVHRTRKSNLGCNNTDSTPAGPSSTKTPRRQISKRPRLLPSTSATPKEKTPTMPSTSSIARINGTNVNGSINVGSETTTTILLSRENMTTKINPSKTPGGNKPQRQRGNANGGKNKGRSGRNKGNNKGKNRGNGGIALKNKPTKTPRSKPAASTTLGRKRTRVQTPTTTPVTSRSKSTTAQNSPEDDVTTVFDTTPDVTTDDITTAELTSSYDLTTAALTTNEITTQELTTFGDVTTIEDEGSGTDEEAEEEYAYVDQHGEDKSSGIMRASRQKRSFCGEEPVTCDAVCDNLQDKCPHSDNEPIGLAEKGSFSNIYLGDMKFRAYCDCSSEDNGWLVIMRNFGGSRTFNRTWEEFANGFGDLTNEFWIGLRNLHELTKLGQYILRLDHRFWYGLTEYSLYGGFKVGSEEDNFPLSISSEKRNNQDVLFLYADFKTNPEFSTFDRDNDGEEARNCAKDIGAGWWYQTCQEFNNTNQFKKMFKRFFRSITEIKIHLSR